MPINFTVVPVEDAEGGSAAADGGAKADSSVPTVVVEDGDPCQAQDSGTSLRLELLLLLWFCSGSRLKTVASPSHARTHARTATRTDYNNTFTSLELETMCSRGRRGHVSV